MSRVSIFDKKDDFLEEDFEEKSDKHGSATKFMKPRTLQKKLKSVLKECGIEYVNFDVLRNTFAAHCVELGFDLNDLSEVLGHANANMVLSKYVHSSGDLQERNMEVLSAL